MKKLFTSLSISTLVFASTVTINGFDIFLAAAAGDSKDLKAILDKGVDVNVKDKNGIPPLIYACDAGNLDNIKFLLQNGANIKAKIDDKLTVSEHCIMILKIEKHKGSKEIITLLASKGAK